jgi:hypothetical protein
MPWGRFPNAERGLEGREIRGGVGPENEESRDPAPGELAPAEALLRRGNGFPRSLAERVATKIYTHVLNRGGRGVQSPLDLL